MHVRPAVTRRFYTVALPRSLKGMRAGVPRSPELVQSQVLSLNDVSAVRPATNSGLPNIRTAYWNRILNRIQNVNCPSVKHLIVLSMCGTSFTNYLPITCQELTKNRPKATTGGTTRGAPDRQPIHRSDAKHAFAPK